MSFLNYSQMLAKVLEYLPFCAIRKNSRLTCHQLNNLCNWQRFLRTEVIVWSEESQSHIASIFQNSSRGWFSLMFSDVTLNVQLVSKFFEEHGAKVQSLSFKYCKSPPGVLESIILRCEALCSLSINRFETCSFSFESNKVTRPTVTSLKLELDSIILQQSPAIFQRIRHLFPCVKHLSIEYYWKERQAHPVEHSVLLDFLVNFSRLESLNLFSHLPKLFFNEPKFLDLLPR